MFTMMVCFYDYPVGETDVIFDDNMPRIINETMLCQNNTIPNPDVTI